MKRRLFVIFLITALFSSMFAVAWNTHAFGINCPSTKAPDVGAQPNQYWEISAQNSVRIFQVWVNNERDYPELKGVTMKMLVRPGEPAVQFQGGGTFWSFSANCESIAKKQFISSDWKNLPSTSLLKLALAGLLKHRFGNNQEHPPTPTN